MENKRLYLPPRSRFGRAAVACSVLFVLFVAVPLVICMGVWLIVASVGSAYFDTLSSVLTAAIVFADILGFSVLYIVGAASAGKTLAPLGAAWILNACCQAAVIILEMSGRGAISSAISFISGAWKNTAFGIVQALSCVALGVMLLLCNRGAVRSRVALLVTSIIAVIAHTIYLGVFVEKLGPAAAFLTLTGPFVFFAVLIVMLVMATLFLPVLLVTAGLRLPKERIAIPDTHDITDG